MPKFIDREAEMKTLEQEYKREGSSLVILYGRRRVGKTTLISEFIKNKNAMFFLASEESEVQNRNAFKEKAAAFIKSDLLMDASVSSWDTIFKAIADTKTIATPKVLGLGTEDGEEVGYSFLLLDFVELGNLDEKFWEKSAENLSKMHKAETSSFIPKEDYEKGLIFGFYEDNYIGRTKQINTPKKNWIDFFRENRLEPQFKMAENHFSSEEIKLVHKLLEKLDSFLVEPEKPSLLHGDLWAGNVMCDTKPQAMLIDPACYVGHPEADIAMTELFGGFSGRFYEAYKSTGLLQPNYADRRDLYNLYHLLNHLNMFGKSYFSAVKAILEKYVG